MSATAVTLIPYPNPAAAYPAAQLRSAIARQNFVARNGPTLSDALLPLAVISKLERGAIPVDRFLLWCGVTPVRRSGPSAWG